MRLTVSGTPAAVVVELPNEDRMSWRTMPESSRTSAPLLPSPGTRPSPPTTESTVSTAPRRWMPSRRCSRWSSPSTQRRTCRRWRRASAQPTRATSPAPVRRPSAERRARSADVELEASVVVGVDRWLWTGGLGLRGGHDVDRPSLSGGRAMRWLCGSQTESAPSAAARPHGSALPARLRSPGSAPAPARLVSRLGSGRAPVARPRLCPPDRSGPPAVPASPPPPPITATGEDGPAAISSPCCCPGRSRCSSAADGPPARPGSGRVVPGLGVGPHPAGHPDHSAETVLPALLAPQHPPRPPRGSRPRAPQTCAGRRTHRRRPATRSPRSRRARRRPRPRPGGVPC